MSYDAEIMSAIAEELYEFHVEREHGSVGLERLRAVLTAVKSLYLFRAPDSFPDGIIVFAPLDEADDILDPQASRVLESARAAGDLGEGVVIQPLSGGRLRAWSDAGERMPDLTNRAVVYVFASRSDQDTGRDPEGIALPAGLRVVRNPNGYPSALAPPTFWNLEDSLSYYATDLARRTTCKILKKAWAVDSEDRHLVFCNKPERTMRESLAQHLRSSLRDHKLVRVNEEQNVSETEPVDIEVTWSLTSQVALIEVKWVGTSLNVRGDHLGTPYFDARAREGARRLAEYLAEFEERNPGHEVRAYLVVFDGRRRGISGWEPGPLSRANAYYYKDRELNFQDAVLAKAAFQAPRRFFIEPKLAT